MKFASSYEPGEYESDIYAAWEASGIFNPSVPSYPVDDDSDGKEDAYDCGCSTPFAITASKAYRLGMFRAPITPALRLG